MISVRTREAVVRACAEYDRLGQERFLEHYGFGVARKYRLVHDGKHYDSKAIVGVAFSFENPGLGVPSSSEFSGGVAYGAAAWQLKRLGFDVETSA